MSVQENIKQKIYKLCRLCGKLNLYVSRCQMNKNRVAKELNEINTLLTSILNEIKEVN